MIVFIFLLFLLLASFLVSNLIGKNRTIGKKWSFFFTLTLGLIPGIVITLLHPKGKPDSYFNKNAFTSRYLPYILLLILPAISFFGTSKIEINSFEDVNILIYLILILTTSGAIGLGFYLSNKKVSNLYNHLSALIIFLFISLSYCKPALDGKVLQQSDVTNWKGAIKNSEDYAKVHQGKYPLWTNNLFSGMPTFQIGGTGGSKILGYAHQVMTLNLPKPVHFFFLACVCFYILCCCLKINPWVGIATSLGYAYATYNPIIISVGHDTKMLSIAYMPAVLAGVSLILNKKYWLGAVLTAIFTGLMVSANHLQIVYYLFIAIGVMCLFALVQYIKNKEFKHLFIAGGLIIATLVLGVGSNAELLMSTYEYQKETIRGGASVLKDTTNKKDVNATGLDKDYAFSYSMFKTEPLVLLFPKMYGGSSGEEEVKQDKSKAIEALSNMPQELQQQLPAPSYYWGGLIDPISVGTSGPPYAGAILCFLAIIAMFIIDQKYKWWMLAAILLTCLMSWGSYFESFNTFLFNNLPFYNKFRAPSMIMVVPQLLITTLAALCLNEIVNYKDKIVLQKQFVKGLIATGVVFIIAFVCYFAFDFISANDKGMMDQVKKMSNPQLSDYIKDYIDGLVSDRKGLFIKDIFRSLGFIIVAGVILFASIKNWIKPAIVALAIGLFAFIDVALVNSTYLNAENYQDKQENDTILNAGAKDNEILADKSDYRVFNVSGNRFSENSTSFLFKSVGGYHPAKLRLYQDLIERQLSKQPNNESVLSMLNVKYLLQKGQGGQTAQYQKLNSAVGSAWFVKNINYVKDADAEMKALDSFDVKATAFVQEQYKNNIPFAIEADTSAIVNLVKNDNDYLEYESNNSKNGFAVFSEIYYKAGWKAFVDGKEMPIIKTNYVLRGLALPAGKHKIEFKFNPEGHAKGVQYGGIANLILGLLLLSLIGYFYFENKKKVA